MFRIQVSLLVGLLVFSLVPLPVFAASSGSEKITESILLSPTSKRYELASGATKRDTFKIFNDGQVAFNFVVYARPYSVSDESYAPNFVSDSQNADAYKWVQFDTSSYYLKPGQSVDVQYTLRVPVGATPGGHYGVLFAETQPVQSVEGTAIIRKKRVGAILYATVDGDVKTSGTLKTTDIAPFQFRAPLTIRQRVANNGNTDFEVTSTVQVSDIFGGLKYKSTKKLSVLPSTTRQIVSDWQNPAWIGLYKVDTKAAFLDTNSAATHYVLLVPIWVYITLVILIGARVLYAVAHRKHKK